MNNTGMEAALAEAQLAFAAGEVPVGCVIQKDGAIIARAHNETRQANDATAHAEMLAIRRAGAFLGDWRLDGCDLYVTLEPCPMCAAAIQNARIRRLYFGAFDMRYGAAGTRYDFFGKSFFGNAVEVYGGMQEAACTALLSRFFADMREKHM